MALRSGEGAQAGGQGWRVALLIGGEWPRPGPAPPRPRCQHPRPEFPRESGASGALRLPAPLETQGTRLGRAGRSVPQIPGLREPRSLARQVS